MHKAVVDPKTGRMRTENATPPVSAEDLQRTRREVRDIVAGNTPFHVDPNAPPTIETEPPLPTIYDEADWYA